LSLTRVIPKIKSISRRKDFFAAQSSSLEKEKINLL